MIQSDRGIGLSENQTERMPDIQRHILTVTGSVTAEIEKGEKKLKKGICGKRNNRRKINVKADVILTGKKGVIGWVWIVSNAGDPVLCGKSQGNK